MKLFTVIACVVLGVWIVAPPTAAGGEEAGVRILATGVVMAKPTRLEIDLETAGQAELSSDAAVKYRTAVQQTNEAFEKLGIKGLKVESGGLGMTTMGPAGANQAAPNASGKAPINITRSFRLVLPNIDKLTEEQLTDTVSKLIDTAKDVGTSIGNSSASGMLAQMMGRQITSSVVSFVVEDVEQHREKAYQERIRLFCRRNVQLAAR